jgi:hypothetical protein
MQKINVLLYHGGCPDGFFGAYACYLKNKNSNITYIPMYYHYHSKEQPFNNLLAMCNNKNVIMVDFSLPYQCMNQLINKSKSFIVLDHHHTAKEHLINIPDKNKIFDMLQSGATLSYNYFFPDQEIPRIFKYVEDRDLWKWSYAESNPFTTALYNKFSFNVKTYNEHEERLKSLHDMIDTDEKINDLINIGKIYLEYKESIVSDASNKYQKIKIKTHDNKYANYVGAFINYTIFASEIGSVVSNNNDIDFTIVYKHSYDGNNHNIYCSIRSVSDECDVSEIAKIYGGGGHKRASGFSLQGDLKKYFDFI